jgi:hypothetical protein
MPRSEATRIRGRLRGFETVWTPERFAEVIRNEVHGRLASAWPPERIGAWVRESYGIDARSALEAQKVVDAVLDALAPGRPARRDARGGSAGGTRPAHR